MSFASVDDPTKMTGEPDPVGAPLREGLEVGRYLLLGRLGAGGMGDVYGAYDPELDRKVALKLVRVDVAEAAADAQARLLREAKALAKLSHPNVVTVFDAGTHEDRVFVAMEFVDGRTLTQWSEADPRSWRDVVAVMLQAGRGLEAAHVSGIVHRDFKPSNVMIDDTPDAQGLRARVLDFGLARGLKGETAADLVSSQHSISQEIRRPRDLSLTQTGVVMGTPSYMAPEQFGSKSVDARTDQFSYCVVLYRLLYGQRPFEGERFDELQDQVLRGRLRTPGRQATVPRRLWTILERGLQREPERRHPSMAELLADLERVVGARRRRLAIGGVVLGLAAVGTSMWSSSQASAVCRGAEQHLQGVWDDETRVAVADAFAAIGRTFADDAWRHAEPRLDDFATAWVQQHTEACEATRIRGEQSESMLDLRMACLDRQRLDAVGLVDLFTQADAKVAENAVASARRLPNPVACADMDALASGVEPPDPSIAQDVRRIEEEIAAVRALMMSGKFQQGLAEAKALLRQAEQIGYRPAIARATLFVAQGHERLNEVEEAVRAYDAAVENAAIAGDARTEAQGLGGRCSVLGLYLNDLDNALRQCRHASAILDRLEEPPEEKANIELQRANSLFRHRRLEEAQAAFERVLEITEGVPSAQPARMGAISNLSGLLGLRGQLEDSLAMAQAGAAWVEEEWGEHHPSRAFLLNNAGATYHQLGRNREAAEYMEAAIEIYRDAFGDTHGELARAYHNLGTVRSTEGDRQGALEAYLHALDVKHSVYPDGSPSIATTANGIADILAKMGREEEALVYIEEALQMWERTQGVDAPEVIVGLVTKIEILQRLERPVDAAFLDRGLAIAANENTDGYTGARFRYLAAKELWRDPGQRARARELAEMALKHHSSAEKETRQEQAEIEAWLSAHPRGKTGAP